MNMGDLKQTAVETVYLKKIQGFSGVLCTDILSVEEPLEIRLEYDSGEARTQKSISVTMRTPGDDADLSTGFLFTEGIIADYTQIKSVGRPTEDCTADKENIICVALQEGVVPKLMQADRNFYTTSSCGVCGKGSIDAIRTAGPFQGVQKHPLRIALETVYQLPQKLRTAQQAFEATGGIHASGLFTTTGELLYLREDVGRHNALDKLIGHAFANKTLPLDKHILLLSGRASFELIQKAAMAGVVFIAAIGAPSSLAVALAKEFDITLVGFLKNGKCNIYHLSTYTQLTDLAYED